LRNKLKRAIRKAKKAYLHSICDKITEFQRTGSFMYIKANGVHWKENQRIQNIGIQDSQANTRIHGTSGTSTQNLVELYYNGL
jgi:hypothetical protein